MLTDLREILSTHRARLLQRIESRIGMNPFADFSAEDVLQEAFADAHQGFDRLRSHEPNVVIAWLNKIIDNRLAQTMRDRRAAKRGGNARQITAADSSMGQLLDDLEDERSETGSDRFATKEVKEAIGDAIQTLPYDQQAVVEKYYLEQEGLDAIAESLDMTKPAVRSLLYRAKISIKKVLGDSSRWYTKK